MREIDILKVRQTVAELCLRANFELRPDILRAIKAAAKRETNVRAKKILKSLVENARLARREKIAICQDTGLVFVRIEMGQDVHLTGGSLTDEVNKGVKEAYSEWCLRKSVVDDPLLRRNTGTNTPCVLFTEIVDGDRLRIEVTPKGFGSENKSAIRMFRPTASIEEIKRFVIDVVRRAGPDACPPLVMGIGIGGDFEGCAFLAKKALLRPVDKRNPKRHIARLERELMREINALGMGPMALGGRVTALGVNIMESPTHIAGLPVAVNVSCHATRGAEKVL